MNYRSTPSREILEKTGVGKSEAVEFYLQKISAEKVKEYIKKLAENDNWKKISENNIEDTLIQNWSAGNFSVSGYQKINVKIIPQNENIKIEAESKSKGGQMTDWGANKYNLTRLKRYLENPQTNLGKRKVPSNLKGLMLLILLMSIIVLLAITIINIT